MLDTKLEIVIYVELLQSVSGVELTVYIGAPTLAGARTGMRFIAPDMPHYLWVDLN